MPSSPGGGRNRAGAFSPHSFRAALKRHQQKGYRLIARTLRENPGSRRAYVVPRGINRGDVSVVKIAWKICASDV